MSVYGNVLKKIRVLVGRTVEKYFILFLVRRDESPENYCHSPGVGVVVRRQKL